MKKENGISMVTLVITIIIMLILAGVVFAITTGDNSTMEQAQTAVSKTRASEINDFVKVAILSNDAAKYSNANKITKDNVIEELLSDGKITQEEAESLENNDTLMIDDVTIDFSKLNEPVDVNKLISKINEGGTINLNGNVEINESITINKDTTINLNGNNLAVRELKINSNFTVVNGTLEIVELEYTNTKGFSRQYEPLITINSGTFTLTDCDYVCDQPCTLVINNNSVIETVGIRVAGGKLVLNNSNITIKNEIVYGNLIQYETLIAIAVENNGSLELNGGSINFNGLGGRDSSDRIAIFTTKSGAKTISVDGCLINTPTYLISSGGTVVVNTTDTQDSWNGKCAGSGYTINYK